MPIFACGIALPISRYLVFLFFVFSLNPGPLFLLFPVPFPGTIASGAGKAGTRVVKA